MVLNLLSFSIRIFAVIRFRRRYISIVGEKMTKNTFPIIPNCRHCSKQYRYYNLTTSEGLAGFCCAKLLKSQPKKIHHEENNTVFCIVTKKPSGHHRFMAHTCELLVLSSLLTMLVSDLVMLEK